MKSVMSVWKILTDSIWMNPPGEKPRHSLESLNLSAGKTKICVEVTEHWNSVNDWGYLAEAK